MAKDPAFLFYSKDWIQGTASFLPEEKGVYIDLLAHQHQDEDLPNDVKRLSRMVGLTEEQFIPIWNNIKHKFIFNKKNRLVNRKLTEITTDRLTRGCTNKIISRFAVLMKSIKDHPTHIKEKIKEKFNITDYQHFEPEEATNRLTEWFTERLTVALEDANANTNEDVISREGGMGETQLCPEMIKVFKEFYPDYPEEVQIDAPNCLQIAYKIAKAKQWSKESVTNGKMKDTLLSWRAIVAFSKSDSWFSGRAISDFNKEYQRLIQKMVNNGTHKPISGKDSITPQILPAGSRGQL